MRLRTKRMKERLQGLIIDISNNDIALKGSKSAFQMSKTYPKMITYLYIGDLEE